MKFNHRLFVSAMIDTNLRIYPKMYVYLYSAELNKAYLYDNTLNGHQRFSGLDKIQDTDPHYLFYKLDLPLGGTHLLPNSLF